MKINSIGFVGGGRITRIILQGLKRAGKLTDKIFVSDTDSEALKKTSSLFPGVTLCPEGPSYFGLTDIVFLAVHAPAMEAVLREARSYLSPETVICSLAPKVPIDKIAAALGGIRMIFRMNPNAPSVVCAGFNPVYFPSSFPIAWKETVLNFLSVLGQTPEVEEKKLEAFAVVSAMGPTYLWFQLYELIDLAQRFGMSEEEALTAVSGMAAGACSTMKESRLSSADVMDLVPVKPLADHEDEIKKAYETRLTAVFSKLTS